MGNDHIHRSLLKDELWGPTFETEWLLAIRCGNLIYRDFNASKGQEIFFGGPLMSDEHKNLRDIYSVEI
jgi:hypothetical protein